MLVLSSPVQWCSASVSTATAAMQIYGFRSPIECHGVAQKPGMMSVYESQNQLMSPSRALAERGICRRSGGSGSGGVGGVCVVVVFVDRGGGGGYWVLTLLATAAAAAALASSSAVISPSDSCCHLRSQFTSRDRLMDIRPIASRSILIASSDTLA